MSPVVSIVVFGQLRGIFQHAYLRLVVFGLVSFPVFHSGSAETVVATTGL